MDKKGIIMKKTKLNLIIDASLLLCLVTIVRIRFLIKHVLVPDCPHREIYGQNVQPSFFRTQVLYWKEFWSLFRDRH